MFVDLPFFFCSAKILSVGAILCACDGARFPFFLFVAFLSLQGDTTAHAHKSDVIFIFSTAFKLKNN